MSDMTPGADTQGMDGQDIAEVFDEDNLDSDEMRVRRDDEELNFDDMPRVFDATRAVGDEDDDEAVIGEDLDDEEIVAAATDNDEDDDDLEDDDLKSRSADQYQPEIGLHGEGDIGNEDPDDTDGVDRGGDDEVGPRYVGDMAETPGGHSAAQRYESRTLSDQDLQSLGYAKADGAKGDDAPHSKDDDAPDALTEDVPEDHPAHPDREDERLDEGVEESFPASDPVSVKHIT